MKTMSKTLQRKLYRIAAKHSIAVEERGDLEYRMSDSLDFLDISVGAIEAMLQEAYELGRKEAAK